MRIFIVVTKKTGLRQALGAAETRSCQPETVWRHGALQHNQKRDDECGLDQIIYGGANSNPMRLDIHVTYLIFPSELWALGPKKWQEKERKGDACSLSSFCAPLGLCACGSMKPSPTLMNCALYHHLTHEETESQTYRKWMRKTLQITQDWPTPNPCIFHVILLSGKKITALFSP